LKLVCINNSSFEQDLVLNKVYNSNNITKNFIKIYINSFKDYIFVSKNRFLIMSEYRKMKISKIYNDDNLFND
jgi:hypothetical protein